MIPAARICAFVQRILPLFVSDERSSFPLEQKPYCFFVAWKTVESCRRVALGVPGPRRQRGCSKGAQCQERSTGRRREPFTQAKCNAVMPFLFLMLTGVPAVISMRHISACPFCAAKCSAVILSTAGSFTSTPGALNNALTASCNAHNSNLRRNADLVVCSWDGCDPPSSCDRNRWSSAPFALPMQQCAMAFAYVCPLH